MCDYGKNRISILGGRFSMMVIWTESIGVLSVEQCIFVSLHLEQWFV